jgi:hypothetical protein
VTVARLRLSALLCVVAVMALGCQKVDPPRPAVSGDLAKGNPTTTVAPAAEVSADAPTPTPLTPDRQVRLDQELASIPDGCEILSTKDCLLPFPSDFHTVKDPTSGTERRVNLPTGQLPNVGGTTLDPTLWNKNDGWSPSTPIIVYVPGLDPDKTALPKEGDVEFSTTRFSATVIVDLTTGQLVPHWAEMDSRATDPNNRALILRPATSLIETHRFAVGLRRMIGTNGAPLPAPITFQAIRDNNSVPNPRVTARQSEFNVVFAQMAAASVPRDGLYLSWYFTVASPETLASRLLAMRDDAFGKLAGQSPKYKVTDVSTKGLQPGIARVVKGTFDVPNYLEGDGGPGSLMRYSPLNGDPTAAVKNGEATPVVYGHGLLGSADEAASSQVQHTAAAINAVYCATDIVGLAEQDIASVAAALQDINKFPTLPDRLQQAMLNMLFLGRLLVNENGLGATKEFQTSSGANLLNNSDVYYDGNSEGAIVGGAVTAVAQDWTKAVLGVGGMNYSTLLNRSVDFDRYFEVLRRAYPDPLQQQIIFGVIQMLWDRGETSGYVQHLTDRTYDRTPPKQVLMTVAFGDHQVATITADNMARTLKIPIYQPTLAKGVEPLIGSPLQSNYFYNLDPIRKFPLTGSALYYWNAGTLSPPPGNITPIMSDEYKAQCSGANADTLVKCQDPHEDPRRQPGVIAQKKAFFKPQGTIINVCKDQPCEAKPRGDFDY